MRGLLWTSPGFVFFYYIYFIYITRKRNGPSITPFLSLKETLQLSDKQHIFGLTLVLKLQHRGPGLHTIQLSLVIRVISGIWMTLVLL